MSLAGNLDLVVGNGDGLLNYFENNGTSTAPAFVQRSLRRFSRGRNLFSETKVPQATDDADAAPEEIVVTPHGHESDQYTEPEEEINTPK